MTIRSLIYIFLIISSCLSYPFKAFANELTLPSLNFRHSQLDLVPISVPVKVSVENNAWTETISICNTSDKAIPLKNIEFNFNYTVPMPTNIWGFPWLNWKLVSQTDTQVTLAGGTPQSPSLPADPDCMFPISIKFNAPPTNPAPTGPFVFKTEIDETPPPSTGNLNLIVDAAPTTDLMSPTLTVSGPAPTQEKVVAWGTNWMLADLPVGTYTISGSAINGNDTTYSVDPITTVVTEQTTTTHTLTYKGSMLPTEVRINLTNAPTAQVPLTLTSSSGELNFTVENGAAINIPTGSYNVTSTIQGFSTSSTPNPLIVPTHTNLNITYTALPVAEAGSRTVKVVNECPFPVWFGFISGATASKTGAACVSDADCYQGSVCVDRGAAPKHCFWKNPIPTNNEFRLEPNGGSNEVVFPYVKTPMNAVFSGAAAGRTNCTGSGCETADCGGGVGGCPPGRGFMQPTTQIEFTFQTNASDFYDLSAVDGMNIPVSMAPTNATFIPTKPYDCGTPGGTVARPPMGACTWDFAPTLVEYKWVRAGGVACTSDANCTAGTVCGLSKNASKPRLRKTCGKLLGYFNAHRICGEDSAYGAPFNCQEKLPAPNDAYTMKNLLGCAPIPSCYQKGATTACCGCANWDTLGIGVPPAPYTQQCGNMNPYWVSRVQPGLAWVKQGCPSIYTYPYDDMSSTFVCRVNKDRDGVPTNSTNYTFTFCPGGKTGGITPLA